MKDIVLSKSLKKKDNLVLKLIKNKKEISENDFSAYDGFLIDAVEKEIRAIVASLKSKGQDGKIVVLGRDDVFNRRILETIKINYLVSAENIEFHNRDSLKQRDSGLNHVLAKIAKEKKIGIVFDVSQLMGVSKDSKKEKALVLARMMQNVDVCRRAKCDLKLASFAENKKQLISEEQIKAFGFSIGMSSQQVRESRVF
jgi:RNase P/RNase MRP subunit p30